MSILKQKGQINLILCWLDELDDTGKLADDYMEALIKHADSKENQCSQGQASSKLHINPSKDGHGDQGSGDSGSILQPYEPQ